MFAVNIKRKTLRNLEKLDKKQKQRTATIILILKKTLFLTGYIDRSKMIAPQITLLRRTREKKEILPGQNAPSMKTDSNILGINIAALVQTLHTGFRLYTPADCHTEDTRLPF
jgi:hypothetical protein